MCDDSNGPNLRHDPHAIGLGGDMQEDRDHVGMLRYRLRSMVTGDLESPAIFPGPRLLCGYI